jgi:hypothetical protein
MTNWRVVSVRVSGPDTVADVYEACGQTSRAIERGRYVGQQDGYHFLKDNFAPCH